MRIHISERLVVAALSSLAVVVGCGASQTAPSSAESSQSSPVLTQAEATASQHAAASPESSRTGSSSDGGAAECKTDDAEDCERQCRAGSGASCRRLARMYFFGSTVAQDATKGMNYAARGCDLGEGGSCTLAAGGYCVGRGAPVDARRAVQLADKGCAAHDAKACQLAASIRARPNDCQQQPEPAVSPSAAPQGDPDDCNGNDVDDCKQRCATGKTQSCYRAGIIYYAGTKIPADYPQALALFTKACGAGHATGCAALGAMYLRGQSVPQDFARSASLAQKACAAGASIGCENLEAVKQQLGGLPPRTSASGTPTDPLPHTAACDPNCFYGGQCDVFQNTPSDETCCQPITISVLDAALTARCRTQAAAANAQQTQEAASHASKSPTPASASRCGGGQHWCGGSSAGTCCAGYQTCCQRRGGNYFCGSGANACGR